MSVPATYHVTIRPAFITLCDPAWAPLFQPGTSMLLNGGAALQCLPEVDGVARYRVQHQYYPPIICTLPSGATTELLYIPLFTGCIEQPQCFHRGLRRRLAYKDCTCLGCWARWWQQQARALGIAYPTKGSPKWIIPTEEQRED